MYCLWCHEEIIPDVTWTNLIRIQDDIKVCRKCKDQFPFIQGPCCKTCSRPMKREGICEDCRRWDSSEWKGLLQQNISVFSYSPFMKDVMTRWKYRGDYVLIHMFEKELKKKFSEHFSDLDAVLVPIPLSEERLQERGFNQAEAVASLLPFPIKNALVRIRNEKQAKKTRAQRLLSSNPFQPTQNIHQPVILIDDLYTTGMTMRWAAQILMACGTPQVFSYTLIRS